MAKYYKKEESKVLHQIRVNAIFSLCGMWIKKYLFILVFFSLITLGGFKSSK